MDGSTLPNESNDQEAATSRNLLGLNRQLRDQARKLKQLNQDLIDGEQRLRLAIETGRIGLWVWNSTDVANSGDWSPRLKEIFGLPPNAQVTHELFLQCVHPEDRERVNKAVMDALAGVNGGTYQEEYRTISPKDGSLHWVTARAQAFFDAKGKPFRFIGTLMEISDRKQIEEMTQRINHELERRIFERTQELEDSNRALLNEIEVRKELEEQLRQSEAYLAEAQLLSNVGSFSLTLPEGILTWSEETVRICEYAPGTPPSLDLAFARVHPEDVPAVQAVHEKAYRERSSMDFEHRLLMDDKSIKYVRVVSRPARQTKDSVTFVGAVVDLTRQKRAEQAIQASERLARGQLSALTRTLDLLSQETDPDQLPKHVVTTIATQMNAHSVTIWERNGEDLELLGVLEEKQFRARRETGYFGGTIPVVGDAPPLWVEAMATGDYMLIEDVYKDDSHFNLADGRSTIWRRDDLPPTFIALKNHMMSQGVRGLLICPMMLAGRLEGIVGIRFTGDRKFTCEDIDLMKALAHQAMLAVQLMRLSRKSRQAAIMAERNRMARDIHDTLAQGFTGVIAQLQAAKGATQLADAAAHVERAEDLARSSLGEARRSVKALRPRSLHEATLCNALENMLKTVAKDSGLTAKFLFEGGQRQIPPEWEEGLLRVVQESLTNAIKHAQARNFSVTLNFETQKIRLKLVDDGRGFNPEEEHEGFGLVGMKERVEQMGGEFVIRSQPGLGTEMVITLECPGLPKPTNQ